MSCSMPALEEDSVREQSVESTLSLKSDDPKTEYINKIEQIKNHLRQVQIQSDTADNHLENQNRQIARNDRHLANQNKRIQLRNMVIETLNDETRTLRKQNKSSKFELKYCENGLKSTNIILNKHINQNRQTK